MTAEFKKPACEGLGVSNSRNHGLFALHPESPTNAMIVNTPAQQRHYFLDESRGPERVGATGGTRDFGAQTRAPNARRATCPPRVLSALDAPFALSPRRDLRVPLGRYAILTRRPWRPKACPYRGRPRPCGGVPEDPRRTGQGAEAHALRRDDRRGVSAPRGPPQRHRRELRGLDASTAVARKYLRLGKFLGNARDLRALLRSHQALTGRTNAVAALVARIESDSPPGDSPSAPTDSPSRARRRSSPTTSSSSSRGPIRRTRSLPLSPRPSPESPCTPSSSSTSAASRSRGTPSATPPRAPRTLNAPLHDHLARYKKTDEVDVDAEEEEEEEEEEEDRRVAGVFRSGSTSLRSSFTGSPMKKAGMFLRARRDSKTRRPRSSGRFSSARRRRGRARRRARSLRRRSCRRRGLRRRSVRWREKSTPRAGGGGDARDGLRRGRVREVGRVRVLIFFVRSFESISRAGRTGLALMRPRIAATRVRRVPLMDG